jgi:hypothetical protein
MSHSPVEDYRARALDADPMVGKREVRAEQRVVQEG